MEDGNIIIEYRKIDKTISSDLTLIQRLMVSGKKRKRMAQIQRKTVIKD